MDTTGDPWNGRTLEWATSSPAPVYNFAHIPQVSTRDAFWEQKTKNQQQTTKYQDIHLPKNSGAGIIVAGFAFVFGFAIIWHIWWLAAAGFLGIIISLVRRTLDDDCEYTITAAQVKKMETGKT